MDVTLMLLLVLPITNESFENITIFAYDRDVFFDYVNESPYFYINSPRSYEYRPVKVCAEVYPKVVRSLGFKVNCSSYDLILTDRKVDGKAVIFGGDVRRERVTKVVWIKNPLNIPPTDVNAKYDIERDGEVIAVYEDGGIAVLRVGEKVYVGFEPTRPTLANILFLQSVRNVEDGHVIVIIVLSSLCLLVFLRFEKLIYKLAGFLSLILLAYIRYDRDYILLNDTRRMIYEFVLDNPGTHLREIIRELKISISTATWHLRVLERAGLLRSKKVGNKLVYYPVGAEKDNLIIVATLNNDKARSIVEYLLNEGNAHARKIAKDLDMNVETVRYHLRKLENMNVVLCKEEGNRIVYSINPEFIPSLSSLV